MKKIFAVKINYRRGSGSKHEFAECHLLCADLAEDAIETMRQEEANDDSDEYEYDAVEVDLEALAKGESQRVYGRYHN